jgi:hypothetical protein
VANYAGLRRGEGRPTRAQADGLSPDGTPRDSMKLVTGNMRVRVKLHGLFTVGVKDPDRRIELTLPDGTDVAGAIEALRETSPMLDPRSCLAMVGGERVLLDRTLKDGEEVCLYPIFGGG